MIKFTISTKELKEMVEKALSAINKKAYVFKLRRIYFQVDKNEDVKILGTDLDQYVEVKSKTSFDTSGGCIGIDVEDVKLLTKLKGSLITIEQMEDLKVNAKCEKKNISFQGYENTDIFLPELIDEEHIFTVKENWFLETIINLGKFARNDDARKILQVINFNAKKQRVESCDGHRIGIRSIDSDNVKKEEADNVMLATKSISFFKKCLNKSSENEIKIYQDEKYIYIEGEDFKYIQRRFDEIYLDVNRILINDYGNKFTVNAENILEVMKYDADLIKNEKKPVIFHGEDGKLYSYFRTSRYEMLDKIDGNKVDWDGYMGFNPNYLVDVFSIIDTENPLCKINNPNAPMEIKGNEYTFIILPVKIEVSDRENMYKFIGH